MKALLLALSAALVASAVSAADFPTRPITLVIGFAPGDPSDVVARLVTRRMEETRFAKPGAAVMLAVMPPEAPRPGVQPPARDVVIVHSSDLHVDHDYTARLHGGDGTAGLAGVLAAARAAGADAVVLAGDTFDCHRLPAALLERTAEVIAGAALPVVLLPGNHDPAVADAVFHHEAFAGVGNLHVLGVTDDEAVVLSDLGLEIWGRPHRDYGDMIPFERPRPRSTRWQVAIGHGHYVPVPDRTVRLRPSWLIGDDELAATAADYVALGHWNRAVRVGEVAAYYSGSPEYAGTVNVVRLTGAGEVLVTRAALDIAREPSAAE
jgi:hypothetical protein